MARYEGLIVPEYLETSNSGVERVGEIERSVRDQESLLSKKLSSTSHFDTRGTIKDIKRTYTRRNKQLRPRNQLKPQDSISRFHSSQLIHRFTQLKERGDNLQTVGR